MIAKRPARTLAGGSAIAATLLLGAIAQSQEGNGPDNQVGPDPQLPEPQQYFLPDMKIAKIVGWKNDDTPEVAGD